MNRPPPPKPPEPRVHKTDWEAAFCIFVIFLFLSVFSCLGMYIYENTKEKEWDIVVTDKYEGLYLGTTSFFVETCLVNNTNKCEIDRVTHKDYDMIDIGEKGTIQIRGNNYE